MKNRPWPIIVLALLHLAAVLGNILMNAYFSHMSFWEKCQEYLMPQNIQLAIFYMLMPILAAFAIYMCKRWSFVLYILIIGLSCGSSYYAYRTKGNVSLGFLILVVALDIAIVAYFVLPAVRVVYFDPRLRWWETQRRYRTDLESYWETPQAHASGHVLNFSRSGLFLKSNSDLPQDGNSTTVEFEHEGQTYRFAGEAILHARQDSLGFGLRFKHDKISRRQAALLVKSFDQAGYMMKERLPTADESFSLWLKRFLMTGRGLIPETRARK